MSCMRSRIRSMLTRPSARASGPPGQAWTPRPNAMCTLALGRSIRNSSGHSNSRGSRFAAPFSNMTGVPGAMSTPATLTCRRARRKSALTGLSMRRASSMKPGMRSLCARSSSWSSGYSAQVLQADGQEPRRRLLAGGEEEGRRPHDVGDVGRATRRDRSQGRGRSARRRGARSACPRCTAAN